MGNSQTPLFDMSKAVPIGSAQAGKPLFDMSKATPIEGINLPQQDAKIKQMEDSSGFLSQVWDWAKKGLVSPGTVGKLKYATVNLEDTSQPNSRRLPEGATVNDAIKEFERRSVIAQNAGNVSEAYKNQSIADTLRSDINNVSAVTSPIATATNIAATGSRAFKALPAVAKSLIGVVPSVGFGLQGAKQALEPAQPGETTLESAARRGGGVGQAILGGVGVYESGAPVVREMAKIGPGTGLVGGGGPPIGSIARERQASNFSAALEMGGNAPKGVMTHEEVSLPIINDVRAEAARTGVTAKDFTGRKGYDVAAKLTSGVRTKFDNAWRSIIDPIADQPASQAARDAGVRTVRAMLGDADLVDALTKSGTTNVDRLMKLGEEVANAKTIGDMDRFRITLNRLSAAFEGKPEAQQYQSPVFTQSLARAADEIRNSMYPEVAARYKGVIDEQALRKFQIDHGAAIQADRLMQGTANAVSRAASQEAAPPSITEEAKRLLSPATYSRPLHAVGGVAQGLFKPSEVNLFNTRMQRVIQGARASEGRIMPSGPPPYQNRLNPPPTPTGMVPTPSSAGRATVPPDVLTSEVVRPAQATAQPVATPGALPPVPKLLTAGEVPIEPTPVRVKPQAAEVLPAEPPRVLRPIPNVGEMVGTQGRWEKDIGSMPGEPLFTLDATKSNPEGKAAIIELDTASGAEPQYELRLPSGELVGVTGKPLSPLNVASVNDLALRGESIIDKHPGAGRLPIDIKAQQITQPTLPPNPTEPQAQPERSSPPSGAVNVRPKSRRGIYEQSQAAGQTEGGAVPKPIEPRTPPAQGSSTTISVPGEGRTYNARYQVRELEDVIPSHSGMTFAANKKYALTNDRDYANPVNQGKIIQNAAPDTFKASYHITDNPDATNGPPIIDSNGYVYGGNGRTMILQRVYKQGGDTAQSYKDMLAHRAPSFGLDPAKVEAMKHPILVREIPRDEFINLQAKQNAITDFNKKGTAEMTPSERAVADSKRISQATLDNVGYHLGQAGETGSLASVLQSEGQGILDQLISDGVISPQERAAYATKSGLTDAGKERIGKLFIGRFFNDAAQMDNTPLSVKGKLERIVGPVAKSNVSPEWNLEPAVREAMDILEEMRIHGTSTVDDLLRQSSMFGESKYSHQAVELARRLDESGKLELSKMAKKYAADAMDSQKPMGAMFGAQIGPQQAFDEAFGAPKNSGAIPPVPKVGRK